MKKILNKFSKPNNFYKAPQYLLILGNGFDIQCGLKTRYPDFFNDIFGVTIVTNINYLYRKYILKKPKEKSKLLNDNVLLLRKRILTAIKNIDITSFATIQKSIIGIRNNFIQSGASQLNRLQIFKKKKINKAEISDLNKFFLFITEINFNSAKFIYEKNIFLTKWDIFFIVNFALSDDSNIWSNIEQTLSEVLLFIDYLHRQPNDPTLFDFLSKNESAMFSKMNNEVIFFNIIKTLFSSYKTNHDILNDLIIFERHFAKYIDVEATRNKPYYKNAYKLITYMLNSNRKSRIDILNFNYTLNSAYIDYIQKKDLPIKIHNIINIHGIADWDDRQNIHIKKDQTFNPPIFGIGNSNIRINDWRYIFTKKARLLSYNVNLCQIFNSFLHNIDAIIVYGHSLSDIDNYYFIKLFQKYDLANSSIKLKIFYIDKGDKQQKRLAIQQLLNRYCEKIKYKDDLKNLLKIQNRLIFEPIPPKI